MGKIWTTEEDEYLLKKYDKRTVEQIAKKLNRTVGAVQTRAFKLHINRQKDHITINLLAKCFQSDFRVSKNWIQKYGLPYTIIPNAYHGRFIVQVEDFWKWAYVNQHRINWINYERYSLCPEPDWLEGLLQSIEPHRKRKKYTPQEYAAIHAMWTRGCSYEEIAKQMGRTSEGIRNMLNRKYQKK